MNPVALVFSLSFFFSPCVLLSSLAPFPITLKLMHRCATSSLMSISAQTAPLWFSLLSLSLCFAPMILCLSHKLKSNATRFSFSLSIYRYVQMTDTKNTGIRGHRRWHTQYARTCGPSCRTPLPSSSKQTVSRGPLGCCNTLSSSRHSYPLEYDFALNPRTLLLVTSTTYVMVYQLALLISRYSGILTPQIKSSRDSSFQAKAAREIFFTRTLSPFNPSRYQLV